jgi:hypothetical protein
LISLPKVSQDQGHRPPHGLIDYIDTKAKCHLKKFTCKGTLRQVFIRGNRREIQPVMLVFRPISVNCCPSNLLSSLYFNSPPLLPLPCVSTYTVNTYTVCKWGGVLGSGPHTDKHLPQSLLRGQCSDDDILLCLLWVLSFYGPPPLSNVNKKL